MKKVNEISLFVGENQRGEFLPMLSYIWLYQFCNTYIMLKIIANLYYYVYFLINSQSALTNNDAQRVITKIKRTKCH